MQELWRKIRDLAVEITEDSIENEETDDYIEAMKVLEIAKIKSEEV